MIRLDEGMSRSLRMTSKAIKAWCINKLHQL